jgi:hypothetical protein
MYKLTDEISKLKLNYDFEQVRFVFDSIIEGTTMAEVFTDQLELPAVSLVWDMGYNFYVGGISETTSDNMKVTNFLREKFRNEKISGAKVYFHSDDWEYALMESLKEFSPKIHERSLLKHDFDRNPSTSVEGNISIREIDKNIIENTRLAKTNAMKDEILGGWRTTDRFFEQGFGYCAFTEESVVCWCTAEYVSKHSCGIGIETIEQFQNKGIASKTVFYFVEKCRQLNVIPYWDSWKNNISSIKVAEKQGFKKILDYKIVHITKS